jgi:hypothetical protein
MEERRISPRRRTFKIGTIAFNRAAGFTARIKNISDTGAGLEVESVVGIPDEFVLDIQADHFRRNCRVVWKQPTRLGVCFV